MRDTAEWVVGGDKFLREVKPMVTSKDRNAGPAHHGN